MSRTKDRAVAALSPTKLTKKDLDEQIARVATELFAPNAEADVEDRDWTPVSISPADFVRRMRRFMVYN